MLIFNNKSLWKASLNVPQKLEINYSIKPDFLDQPVDYMYSMLVLVIVVLMLLCVNLYPCVYKNVIICVPVCSEPS